MTLTPKKDFHGKKQFAEAHRDLVVATNFREALNAALLEQVLNLPVTTNHDEAVAAYNQIIGSRLFINQLLNIAEVTKAVPQPLPTNLDHQIR